MAKKYQSQKVQAKNIQSKNEPKEKKIELSQDQIEKDIEEYRQFAELHLLQYNHRTKQYVRKALSEKALKKYDELELKFKKYPGIKPIKTKTVFFETGFPTISIIKGYAPPKPIYEIFFKAGKNTHYFET